jgi:hypothetical protein
VFLYVNLCMWGVAKVRQRTWSSEKSSWLL